MTSEDYSLTMTLPWILVLGVLGFCSMCLLVLALRWRSQLSNTWEVYLKLTSAQDKLRSELNKTQSELDASDNLVSELQRDIDRLRLNRQSSSSSAPPPSGLGNAIRNLGPKPDEKPKVSAALKPRSYLERLSSGEDLLTAPLQPEPEPEIKLEMRKKRPRKRV